MRLRILLPMPRNTSPHPGDAEQVIVLVRQADHAHSEKRNAEFTPTPPLLLPSRTVGLNAHFQTRRGPFHALATGFPYGGDSEKPGISRPMKLMPRYPLCNCALSGHPNALFVCYDGVSTGYQSASLFRWFDKGAEVK